MEIVPKMMAQAAMMDIKTDNMSVTEFIESSGEIIKTYSVLFAYDGTIQSGIEHIEYEASVLLEFCKLLRSGI